MTASPPSSNPQRHRWMARLFGTSASSENALLLALSMTVGILSGLGAAGFHWLIEGTHALSFELLHLFPMGGEAVPVLRTVLPPLLGGLVAGMLVWALARSERCEGTASVMEAVALHDGRLKARPFLVNILASGLFIGTGGSAGPEDPSVQIGAVAGASVAQRLRLSARRATTLTTAGVASAIAAIFNAPIAGVFFGLEIVASDFSTTLFAPVVLAAVTGSIVGRALLGEEAVFPAPAYHLINPLVETPLYALLGLIAAVAGVSLVKAIFLSETLFDRIPLPRPLRAGLGGLLVGLIALFIPGVLGIGYDTTGEILHGTGPIGLSLLLLLAAKFLATVISLGAARVGGTFAPSLVMGAMVGALFGQVVNLIFPGMTGPPAAYALVGMGAVLTAVVRAPITAVLLLFEVTNNYAVILAIMACVVASYLCANWLYGESIYTARLLQRGIQLRFGRDVNILELVTVGEAMTADFTSVPDTMSLRQLRRLFNQTHHHGFPVLDSDGKLFGVVTITDLRRVLDAALPQNTPVAQFATRDLIVAYPDQSLNAAMRQFALADVGRLPVVDRADPQRLLGLVRRADVLKAYRRATVQRTTLERRHQQMRLSSRSGAQVVEITLPPNGGSTGRLVRDLGLPDHVIITSILRKGQSIIPRGDTILHRGDLLTVLAMPDQVSEVEALLLHGPKDETGLRYHELVLPQSSPVVGKRVAELGLPPDVLIVMLHRHSQTYPVSGHTRLEADDKLVILSSPDDFQATLGCLDYQVNSKPG